MKLPGIDAVVGSVVARNNRRIAESDPSPIVRDTVGLQWAARLRAAWPLIRSEWDEAVRHAYQLPDIEAVLTESQGNVGRWSAGMLVVRRAGSLRSSTAVNEVADRFPRTTALLLELPQIRSAMFSVLDPGAQLPTHVGPNAGVLRYHLGVDCPPLATLTVSDRNGHEAMLTYRDGEDVLFSDITPHSAQNRGDRARITLFCEVTRPLRGRVAGENELVQQLLALDPRYRRAAVRAAELSRQLNRTESEPIAAHRLATDQSCG